MMRLAFAAGFLALAAATPAAAQNRLYIECPNGPICSSVVNGHVDQVGTGRLPWVASLITPAGQCLIVQRLLADAELLVTIIAPDGRVFRGDGFAFVDPTVNGWYTVQFDSKPPAREQIFRAEMVLLNTGECRSNPGQ